MSHTGYLGGYGKVWFDPDAVANILSLGRATKKFKVTLDIEKGGGFVLHLPDGRIRNFEPTGLGLYASEFKKRNRPNAEISLAISTEEGNKAEFTKRELKQAERARRLQTTLMFPNDRHMKNITEVLQDCPVTPQDVANATKKFGPSIGALNGRTTNIRPTPVTVVPFRIPTPVLKRLKDIHLHADVCFVNGVGFLVSISDKDKFCTSEAVGNRTDDMLVGALKKIQNT